MDNNEFWQTKRGKALIKLCGYIIFIIFVFIYINTNSNPKNETKDNKSNDVISSSIKEISFYDMQQDLLKNNYKYKYEVTINNNKTTYEGVRTEIKDEGYKETNNKLMKYLIEENKTYEIKLGEKKEITNLYQNIDSNYLNSEYLIKLIENKQTVIKDNIDTKEYTYNLDDLVIVFFVDDKSIYKINVQNNNQNYDLYYYE